MKLAVKITMDDLIRALRIKAHDIADRRMTMVKPAKKRAIAVSRRAGSDGKAR